MSDIKIVIDNGSGYCKAGIAGANAPSSSFPTVVGRPKDSTLKDVYIGYKAIELSDKLNLSLPIEWGLINNWNDMEQIWNYIFKDELKQPSKNATVLLTEPSLNPTENREKTTQIMFENFEVSKFYLCIQSTLALYASGRKTGLVLDSGDGITHTVPVLDGYAVMPGIRRLNLAGRHVTGNLMKNLISEGYDIKTTADRLAVTKIKESKELIYVALDYEAELKKAHDTNELIKDFTLPDGQVIKLNENRFKNAEIMFQPKMVNVELEGLSEMIVTSISQCDEKDRASMYKNLVLAGGNCLFSGIEDRIKKDLSKLKPDVRVDWYKETGKRRLNATWIGGSILASLTDFDSKWITKAEYDEFGPSIVNKKCC